MAPSFFLLAPEIRNKIYGYLLSDIKIEFTLDHMSGYSGTHSVDRSNMTFLQSKHRPCLHRIAILGTCRRIYTEAITFLYEENCFCYDPHRLYVKKHWGDPPFLEVVFPTRKLDMIRTVCFVVDQYGTAREPSWIAEGLRYFSTSGCSLKRLILQVQLNSIAYRNFETSVDSDDDNYDNFSRPVCMSWARNTIIGKAVSSLQVSEEIVIQLSDRLLGSGRHFVRFVQSIATAKSWDCYKKLDLDENGDDRPFVVQGKGPGPIHWCWYLRPPGTSLPRHLFPCQLKEPDPPTLTKADNSTVFIGMRISKEGDSDISTHFLLGRIASEY